MKSFSNRQLSGLYQSGVVPGVALILGGLMMTGCGRKPLATDAPTPAPAGAVAVAEKLDKPAYVPPTAPTSVATGADGGADLKELNHAYIGWIVQNHRRPKTFEEYIALSGMHVPPAPGGKKYVIEKSGFITLTGQ